MSFCAMQDVLALLKACPNLIHGAFSITSEEVDDIPRETISMKHLTSLWITEHYQGSSGLANLYDFIHAPRLQYIEYENNGTSLPPDHLADNLSSSILPLIERTPELNRLALERFILSPAVVNKLIHIVSSTSLVKLVLTSTDSYVGTRILDPFYLRWLIAQIDINSGDTLLPRLEDFELHTTRTSDDTILQFITSHMGTVPHIAILKRVKIVLDRLKVPNSIDIHEAVQARSQMLGISINLLLEYPLPSDKIEGYADRL